jgi:hypothetical protein
MNLIFLFYMANKKIKIKEKCMKIKLIKIKYYYLNTHTSNRFDGNEFLLLFGLYLVK